LQPHQQAARAAARRAKKARQKANKAEKKAAAAAASEAERADYPHAQLRENVEFVMDGLEAATQAARNPTGSNSQVAYSLPPEGGSGFGDLWCTPRSLWAPWRRRSPGTGSPTSSTSPKTIATASQQRGNATRKGKQSRIDGHGASAAQVLHVAFTIL